MKNYFGILAFGDDHLLTKLILANMYDLHITELQNYRHIYILQNYRITELQIHLHITGFLTTAY